MFAFRGNALAMNLRRSNFVAQGDECHRRGWNQAEKLCNCLNSFSSTFLGYWEIWSKKIFYRLLLEQLIQVSYLLLYKEIFLDYSSSESVRAKGNSPDATWLMWPLVYLHVIEINIKLWTKTCPKWHTLSEQIPLVAIFYFGKVFVFCWFISENVLEWFLLIICKETTLARSTNLSRCHSILRFWLRREGRQMPNT